MTLSSNWTSGLTAVFLKKIGLTRLSDITSLDTVGIPVWTSFRSKVDMPESNISVYNGKGFTHGQARIGAIMEAVERYSAEKSHSPLPILKTSENELCAEKIRYMSPKGFPNVEGLVYRKNKPLEWTWSRNLFDGKRYLVSAHAAFCPYLAPEGTQLFAFANSNGLASSYSKSAATVSGILEIIERDHTALTRIRETDTCLDPSEIRSRRIRWLLRKIHNAGINVVLKDITGEFGIPTFLASTDDPVTRNVHLLNSGHAAHWDAETALSKAILEAVQSRLTSVQGAREDLERYSKRYGRRNYERLRNETLKYFFDTGRPKSDLNRHKKVSFKSPDHALDYLLRILSDRGFNQVFVVDHTREETGIPVVKCIIPGMEQVYHYDYARRGPRLKRAIRSWIRRQERKR